MKALYIIGLALLISACGGDEQEASDANLNTIIELEEKIQRMNIIQLGLGDSQIGEVKGELISSRTDSEFQRRNDKFNIEITAMAHIDKVSEVMIHRIDLLKLELLKAAGEDVSVAKNKIPDAILWSNYDRLDNPCRPIRMNLFAIKDRDNHEVVTKMFVDASGNQPSKTGKGLWDAFIQFRADIVSITGTYYLGREDFSINPKAINDFSDWRGLDVRIRKMIESNPINKHEDTQVLIELYSNLTKQEIIKVNGTRPHWIAYKFNNVSLVGAIAELTALQQDILAARGMALTHWKMKVASCGNSFNKIIPLAYGPSLAINGEEIEIMVMMAAFDSDREPEVTTYYSGAKIEYREDGIGYVTVKPKKGMNTIRGTVSITNKSGVRKTEEWEYSFNVE